MRASPLAVRSGRVVTVQEIVGREGCGPGDSVRVTGRLREILASRNVAVVEDPSAADLCLSVGLAQIGALRASPNELVQVIGELREDEEVVDKGNVGDGDGGGDGSGGNGTATTRTTNRKKLLLVARVVRSVEGLDVDLYTKVLHLRRKFLDDMAQKRT